MMNAESLRKGRWKGKDLRKVERPPTAPTYIILMLTLLLMTALINPIPYSKPSCNWWVNLPFSDHIVPLQSLNVDILSVNVGVRGRIDDLSVFPEAGIPAEPRFMKVYSRGNNPESGKWRHWIPKRGSVLRCRLLSSQCSELGVEICLEPALCQSPVQDKDQHIIQHDAYVNIFPASKIAYRGAPAIHFPEQGPTGSGLSRARCCQWGWRQATRENLLLEIDPNLMLMAWALSPETDFKCVEE
ncbi:uncharacterized protein BDR25DRAFT_392887 [Lindgomyces ingoldianus]|uniref:Uncharacterized protein n=1 Tax=Lindgomyces ingoldianus TaxID=673940 RepID=A0ACB6R0A9_9PLEO|nr:uncharacterized protein BDR25DRAFT_392887 [Lindgomyces ingoldianus]KAF2472530.1 hypothetical protein BDR25DRAFT_392887 [Lindgomyces ingoldianus]